MITFDVIRPFSGRVKETASACSVDFIVHKGHIKLLFRYHVIAYNVVMNCPCQILCDIDVFVVLVIVPCYKLAEMKCQLYFSCINYYCTGCNARDKHDQNVCLQALIWQSCRYIMLSIYKGLHIINGFISRCMIH